MEPVESAHLEGAVVGAVARSDTTVIGHLIDPLIGVGRRRHWAHRLTRSVVAVLAHHGHVDRLRVGTRLLHLAISRNDTHTFFFSALHVPIGSIETVNPHPVHVAVAADFVLADHGHVVLDVASRHTRAATDATREVNGHAPAVTNTVYCMLMPHVKLTCSLFVEGVDFTVAVDVVVDIQADAFCSSWRLHAWHLLLPSNRRGWSP